jgi:hypothetical protein
MESTLEAADCENPPPDDASMVPLLQAASQMDEQLPSASQMDEQWPAASQMDEQQLPAASSRGDEQSLMHQLFSWHLEEILQEIFLGLDAESLKNARLVNSEWNYFIRCVRGEGG